ncbi:MAG: TIGR02710 family CRISPR-associated protein [Phycisphaerales bacterium]|nr:TIGR02710 family CRISPR-associated protein [Phycisphaerales bacterium]MCB9855311.1 TIGR02710 family CRISPR-associated protein [Phycisphaerales bacterium]MCB9862904.1 TIGR02710 family CRISPR-associated protein [Phycisphaerales bacterium]
MHKSPNERFKERMTDTSNILVRDKNGNVIIEGAEVVAQKVLILTVGTGRVRDDIANALCFSIQRCAPARVVFLCSEKTAAETLPLITKKLGWAGDRYSHHVCRDEDDPQALFLEWNRAWSEWTSADETAEVVVDYTSGTKPMSAAAMMLAISRGARTLSYIVGQRDESGRVVESTDVRSIEPDLIVAHRQLRLAREMFHAGNYAAARDLAAPLLKIASMSEEGLREIARALHYAGDMYDAWQRFDWKAARSAHHNSGHPGEWGCLEEPTLINDNRKLIDAANKSRGNQEFGAPLVADLVSNIDRCMRQGRFDDAVARMYRAIEMLVQKLLLEKHELKSGNIDIEKLPAGIRREYEKKKGDREKLTLGVDACITLLEQLNDPVVPEFRRRYGSRDDGKPGELANLLGRRNQSLLAHGVDPIGSGVAEKLRAHVIELARLVDDDIISVWMPKAAPVRFRVF